MNLLPFLIGTGALVAIFLITLNRLHLVRAVARVGSGSWNADWYRRLIYLSGSLALAVGMTWKLLDFAHGAAALSLHGVAYALLWVAFLGLSAWAWITANRQLATFGPDKYRKR